MRNLLGRLLDRPPSSLATIAKFWEVDLRGRDAHEDVGHLYRVVTDPWVFALTWEHLSVADRRIAGAFVDTEAALLADEIAGRVGTNDEVLPALRRLYRAGLLYSEQPAPDFDPQPSVHLFMPREFAHLITRLEQERERGMPVTEPVAELLDRLTDVELAEVAGHFGYQVIPAVAMRPDIVSFLVPRLVDPDAIQSVVRTLSPSAARLWNWLCAQNGVGCPPAARQALGLEQAGFRQAVLALAGRGLIWRGYEPDAALQLVVPDTLRNPEPRPQPPPPKLIRVDAAEISLPNWVHPYAAAWDLLTVLRTIADGRLPGRPGGFDTSGGVLRRLAPQLWHRSGAMPPPGYVSFLLTLGEGLGLLSAERGQLVVEHVRAWTRLNFGEQASRLVHLWRHLTTWPEGASLDALQVWGADWPGFRSQLLAGLSDIEPGHWYTVESYSARFAAANPNSLGRQFTAAASREGLDEPAGDRRHRILCLAAETTLTTAVAWLGLVELAQRQGMNLFSLSTVGASFLSTQEPPPVPGHGSHPLVTQPNSEVLLLEASPRRIWILSSFAELQQLDHVSVYRLTRGSIERGLRAGLTIEQITSFLEQHGAPPVPQNVAYQIEESAREYRRVWLRHALVVEPDELSAMAHIEQALRAAGFSVERDGASRLLVLLSDDDGEIVERVEHVLRSVGQTPQVSG